LGWVGLGGVAGEEVHAHSRRAPGVEGVGVRGVQRGFHAPRAGAKGEALVCTCCQHSSSNAGR
jgi:hypothetical protein